MGIKPDLLDQQRANLRKLAAYLRTLPANYPDFEMNDFVRFDGSGKYVFASVTPCGTAACAVGHGPKAGISPIGCENWTSYSHRCFIDADDGADNEEAWEWCFGGSWSYVDNTVHGAAARIEYMLQYGVPSDSWAQRSGDAALSYSAEVA